MIVYAVEVASESRIYWSTIAVYRRRKDAEERAEEIRRDIENSKFNSVRYVRVSSWPVM